MNSAFAKILERNVLAIYPKIHSSVWHNKAIRFKPLLHLILGYLKKNSLFRYDGRSEKQKENFKYKQLSIEIKISFSS